MGASLVDKLSEQARACYEHALDAKRKAQRTADPALKTDFVEMEKRWLRLADSYLFSEKLTDFIAANLEWRRRFDEPSRVSERPHHTLRLEETWQQRGLLARQVADDLKARGEMETLRESKQHFRWLASIVEWSDDAIIGKTLDGIVKSWNKGAERLFGYLAEEIVGQPVTVLIPPERLQQLYALTVHIRRGDRVEYETVHRRKDGSPIDVSLIISPIRDGKGKIIGASKIARDITDRKRREAQLFALANEAEHRGRNLFANMTAIVGLSQSDTPNDLKEAIRGRIRALASVHSLFAQSRWMGAELAALVKQELSPYSRDGEVRTKIDGPAIMVEPKLAQAMAVALHELATNAVKYGALSGAKGQVRVEWSRITDRQLVLRWTEAGGPRVSPPARKGFGTSVIERMIRDGVNGRVQLDWRAEGLACEIAVPT